MRHILWKIGLTIFLCFLTLSFCFSQKVKTKDGVRVVHNGKEGTWGKEPKVSLEYVKTIGDNESTDDNILFYMPTAMAFDEQGNMYVLDSGNHRIQKFDADGKYLATIGNQGQGPGEFQYPQSIDVDADGMLYVSESMNRRIQILTPEGEEIKTVKMIDGTVGLVRVFGREQMLMGGAGLFSFGMGMMGEEEKELPKFLKILDKEGEVLKDFGEQQNFKDFLMNRMGNQFHLFLIVMIIFMSPSIIRTGSRNIRPTAHCSGAPTARSTSAQILLRQKEESRERAGECLSSRLK